MYTTIKKINCQYRLKSLCLIALLGVFGVAVVGFYPAYAQQQAAGTDYTPEQLNTSLEAALKAREALLKQLTNTNPPGYLENATANNAPADLLQVLRDAIAAVRAEIAILKRCTDTFPLSDADAAKCLTDLQASSKKIADAVDAATKKLQEKITRLEGLGIFELAAYGREKRDRDLALLRPILMVAQTQKAAVTAAIAQWRRYAQGNMVRPPMPMPPPPTTPMPVPPPMDPPSPFSPVPEKPEPAVVPPMMLAMPMPRTRAEYEAAIKMLEAMIKQLDADYAAMKNGKK